MKEHYNWDGLPKGVVSGAKNDVCAYITDGRYNYFPYSGSFTSDAGTPLNPDAAAEAYAKLRAAAQACEVTWQAEWGQATGCRPQVPRDRDGAGLHVDGITLVGSASRTYRVRLVDGGLGSAYAVKRIADAVAKLDALGWKEG